MCRGRATWRSNSYVCTSDTLTRYRVASAGAAGCPKPRTVRGPEGDTDREVSSPPPRGSRDVILDHRGGSWDISSVQPTRVRRHRRGPFARRGDLHRGHLVAVPFPDGRARALRLSQRRTRQPRVETTWILKSHNRRTKAETAAASLTGASAPAAAAVAVAVRGSESRDRGRGRGRGRGTIDPKPS